MNTESTIPCPTRLPLVDLLRQLVLPLCPPGLREPMENALPSLSLMTQQLGLEVLVAEQQSIRFSVAVTRIDFLKMARVYFGASNLLQWKLPPPVIGALKQLLNHALTGDLNPARRLLFRSARSNDPDGAVCRFLIWTAIRVNLLVLTWDKPGVELRGSLDDADDEAETVLRRILASAETFTDDARPLHELVAELMIYVEIVDCTILNALNGAGSALIQELLTNAQALGLVRNLDSAAAAAFYPGRSDGTLGSQQIADRYPQLFTSSNLVEQRRSRVLKQSTRLEAPGGRLIDIIREFGEVP